LLVLLPQPFSLLLPFSFFPSLCIAYHVALPPLFLFFPFLFSLIFWCACPTTPLFRSFFLSCLSYCHTHTHTHTHFFSFSFISSCHTLHSSSFSPTYLPTHTHIPFFPLLVLPHTHIISLFPFFYPSILLPHTPSSLSISFYPTYLHRHTHTFFLPLFVLFFHVATHTPIFPFHRHLGWKKKNIIWSVWRNYHWKNNNKVFRRRALESSVPHIVGRKKIGALEGVTTRRRGRR
jgi:hypothetical protein